MPMKERIEMAGSVVGRLRIVCPAFVDKWGNCWWEAECICSTRCTVNGVNLRKAQRGSKDGTFSCGCQRRERCVENITNYRRQRKCRTEQRSGK